MGRNLFCWPDPKIEDSPDCKLISVENFFEKLFFWVESVLNSLDFGKMTRGYFLVGFAKRMFSGLFVWM